MPPYENRANLYTKQGKVDQAIESYSQVIRIEPNYLPAYKYRAELYEKKGQKSNI